ncbi:MAG: branched-chain amino acid ABC transporter permease [Ectothiorhodospiraceae bacterium]|nr:branched-chain amino acid ABC transporter permease [Ectothiorhodospiraceae bacterium]
MLSEVGLVVFNGLTWGMAVFLVAAGLTLVFGILHILNFSHGGFFMIGAYVSYQLLVTFGGGSALSFYLAAAFGGGLVVAFLGYVIDRLVLRRLKHVDHAYSLIATYALLVLCEGFVEITWGVDYRGMATPEILAGASFQHGIFMPTYSMFVIGAGVVLFLMLDAWMQYSRTGKLVRSVAIDPWMSGVLGVNTVAVYTAVVVVGFFLAGLAGGLLAANQSLSPALGSQYIIQAFGVIIVGGIGSVRGAFLASVLLGIVVALESLYFPYYPGMLFYLAVALFVMFRPAGLIKQRGVA